MRKVTKTAMAIVISASCIGIGTIVANGAGLLSAQAGDAQDPLVTKSYVDQQIAKALGNAGGSTNTGGATDTTTSESSASAQMEIVTIQPGQQLIAKGGAEFVIRAGKAVIYSADGSGVSDLTAGADLMNGANAPSNHLLMFPRDGRGITAVDATKNVVTVMVRGDYAINNDQAADGGSTN